MNTAPILSVVMPVYNGDKFLAEAIESVINQTFADFELIIINDGSTDNSLSIIQSYMSKEIRIKLIDRANKGLVASLNEGISMAEGEFIARMDADDICFPTRFEEQLNFMKTHNLDLCGTWIQNFREDEDLEIREYPEKHADIVISSIFYCNFAHPSTIIRNKIFESLKYENKVAEDYNLWCNIILSGYRVGNLPKVLLRYRIHEQQITKLKANEIYVSTINISKNFANKLGLLEGEVAIDKELFMSGKQRNKFLKLSKNLDQLIESYNANKKTKYNIMLWLYIKSQPKTPLLYFQYLISTSGSNKNFKNEVKLFLKSFIYLQPNSVWLSTLRKIYYKDYTN